jgi:hypothetical protein
VLGYLRTYICLIRYESDFRIAVDDKLQIIPPGITFLQFCNFIAPLENLDNDVAGRYAYGEIRLTRLNMYSKIFLKKWVQLYMHDMLSLHANTDGISSQGSYKHRCYIRLIWGVTYQFCEPLVNYSFDSD